MSSVSDPSSSLKGEFEYPKSSPIIAEASSSKKVTEDRDASEEAEKNEDERDGSEGERDKEDGKDDNNAKPSNETFNPTVVNAHTQGDWQAIWSAQHNMYYFYNLRTKETTWKNPLQPDSSSSAGPSAVEQAISSAEAAAIAAGVDPGLAYLDPTLASGGPSNPAAYTYAAKFNSRTGAFTAMDGRTPDHISEFERMKRMNSFYFDQEAWEKNVEEGQAEEAGKKRKKPSKKDLVSYPSSCVASPVLMDSQESFKERKRQKKLAKTAWLRT